MPLAKTNKAPPHNKAPPNQDRLLDLSSWPLVLEVVLERAVMKKMKDPTAMTGNCRDPNMFFDIKVPADLRDLFFSNIFCEI